MVEQLDNARVLTLRQLSGNKKLARAILCSSNKKTPVCDGDVRKALFITS
jgi:hypothetical protein